MEDNTKTCSKPGGRALRWPRGIGIGDAPRAFRPVTIRVPLAPAAEKKRQIYHTTTGLALCPCLLCRFSITKPQIAMIQLRNAALANARQPGFSAFIFSDVKTLTRPLISRQRLMT